MRSMDLLVETVDGEPLERDKARTMARRDEWGWAAWSKLSQRRDTAPATDVAALRRAALPALFYAGFAALPWLWAVNVWMFWPDFRSGDVVVKTCACTLAHEGAREQALAAAAWHACAPRLTRMHRRRRCRPPCAALRRHAALGGMLCRMAAVVPAVAAGVHDRWAAAGQPGHLCAPGRVSDRPGRLGRGAVMAARARGGTASAHAGASLSCTGVHARPCR